MSPRRFAAATELIEAAGASAQRAARDWGHVFQLWAGFDSSRERARRRISTVVEQSYRLAFERYTPCGTTPDDVAATLVPYTKPGCRCCNFVGGGRRVEAVIVAIAEVKKSLDPSATGCE